MVSRAEVQHCAGAARAADRGPNVDFHSGIIYEAMRFPVDMFPVLFAIGRTPGWLAQWQEMLLDKEQKIARPRQVYVGPPMRAYVPIEKR